MNKQSNRLLLIAILIISSCQQFQETEESKFKSYVGIGEFQQLNSFMTVMENKFMQTYKVENINDAYNSYTTNKVLGKSHIEFDENDCLTLELIRESGLVDKHARFKYDTVYQEDKLIVTVHNKDTSWLIKPPEKYEGEYRDKVQEEGFRMYLHINELYEGIKYANSSDTLISQIVETREQLGYLNTETLTKAIHLKRVNYVDNFLYRVLICMETYLNELKEYGC